MSINNAKEATREDFLSYWEEEHGDPTLENMMLDSNAAAMDVLERPEILAELPSLNGKCVLELGAGIGRFSSSLAEKASSVVSVDFVEASCRINREANSRFENLEVVCEDALKLEFEVNSFDIVFSNWLLMYLSDEEVQTLATKCLDWLKPGGRIFFRESCFHQSGNAPRAWNPTVYRDPRTYFRFFNSARGSEGSRFQLCKTSCVHAYVRVKNNPNQVWWVWEKCTSGHLIRYLDTQQYDYNSVFRYESLYGSGFMSTGGLPLIENVVSHINLKPGARVLDVGCGLGGNTLFFASCEAACFVHGIDISGILVSVASERYLKYPAEIQKRISIQVGDIFDSNFIPNSFDVICCRDFLMHFSQSDKDILVSKFHKWLAPGGSVIISDYVRGSASPETYSTEFKTYLADRKYQLSSDEEYMRAFENLNFTAKSLANIGLGQGKHFEQYLTEQLDQFKTLSDRKRAQFKSLREALNPSELFGVLYKTVTSHLHAPAVQDDELAIRVAQSGATVANQYLASRETQATEDQENDEWVDKYWNIKLRAVRSNELSYSVFLAKKSAS